MCGQNRESGIPSALKPACLPQSTLSVIMQGSPGCENWSSFGPGLHCCQPGNLPLAQTLRDAGTEPSRASSCPQEGRGVFSLLPRLTQQHVANRTDPKMN